MTGFFRKISFGGVIDTAIMLVVVAVITIVVLALIPPDRLPGPIQGTQAELFSPTPRPTPINNDANLQRFVDKDAGVVCWTYYQGGIYCMPVGETRLDP